MVSLLQSLRGGAYNQHQSSIRITALDLTRSKTLCAVRCKASYGTSSDEEKGDQKKLRILIAGGGIGGLVLGLAAKNRGYDVKVFERDLSAVRGEGRHRGPIQLSSSALGVLQAIDEHVAKQIMEAGCVTGDRINGLADGISGEWFTKFDLLTPALRRGLPITQTICRMELQDILVNSIGFDILTNNSKVVDFIQDSDKVIVILEDGRRYKGDILVGADGIWSEVRTKLFGLQEAKYSGYTCYSGITDFVPPYIDTVGYRVFIGLKQCFVASDVGNGKMQWYAFYNQPPMNTDPPGGNGKKKRLVELFGQWCGEVIDLITKTPEDVILRRDIYDRDMIDDCWGIGRVTLLGDAAHPMQPNLGQGGCMAIEDCYQLVLELDKAVERGCDENVSALRSYEKKRRFRVSTVHAASRMASKMLASYQPYIQFRSSPLRIKAPMVHVARAILQHQSHAYRDRAAERRTLHGGFDVGARKKRVMVNGYRNKSYLSSLYYTTASYYYRRPFWSGQGLREEDQSTNESSLNFVMVVMV